MSVDTNCAWDYESWDVWGLRHEGWGYLTDRQAAELDIVTLFDAAMAGNKEAQQQVSETVYKAVLSGKGCPNDTCGFAHQGDGPYRRQQQEQLVFDGITDEDVTPYL